MTVCIRKRNTIELISVFTICRVHLSCGYSGNLQSSNDCSNDFDIEMFCSGSASTPRGFISPLIYLGTNGTECPIELNEVVEQMGPPLVTQCSTISEKMCASGE